MSEPKTKPDKPNQQGNQGSPGNQGNHGGQGNQGNQGSRPRDPRSLIYHEERGQNPDTITTQDLSRGRRMIERKDQ